MSRALGRIKPTHAQLARFPRLMDHLKAPLPVDTTPDDVDNLTGAPLNMGGNDTVGDCTIAGMANTFAVWAHALGLAITVVASKLVAFYFSMTGGQDTGLVETDVIAKMVKDGIDLGDGVTRKIVLPVRVPIRDLPVLRFLIWQLKSVYLGVELSDNDCQASSWALPSGNAEADKPNQNNGHCIIVGSAGPVDANGNCPLGYGTWGEVIPGDHAWLVSRGDEGWCFIDEEAASKVGFDWASAVQFLQNVPTS